MPVCTLHLVSLSSSIPEFLRRLYTSAPEKPIVVSRVIRWVIVPSSIDTTPLLGQRPLWDLLVVLKGTDGLPSSLLRDRNTIQASYTLRAGVPSSLVNNFAATNDKLLHPQRQSPSSSSSSSSKKAVPALTGALDKPRVASSAQNLEFTDELNAWLRRWDADGGKGAVSMLNLLKFKPGMHGEYLKYGKAFAESIGSRRGGNAKIVGKVVPAPGEDRAKWDEIALAHYPSIRHFADMAASEDYQAVNMKHRVPSLEDTCILCTHELDPDLLDAARQAQAKL